MKEKITDHLGNEYITRKSMCEHYGISESAYYQRVHFLDWSKEKALTTPLRKKGCASVKNEDVKPTRRDYKRRNILWRNKFVPLSNLCSMEYIRFLRFKGKHLRDAYQELCENQSADVLDALLKEEYLVGKKEREISDQAFFFRAYDLYAASEHEQLKHFATASVIHDAELLFAHPEIMPDIMKEIYIRFNEEYKITESIVR